VKLAVVVQRYGAEINGGAEQHARYIAERLSRRHDVEVLTTCARDYVTWANDLPAGVEDVHGVPVRRFPVSRERDVLTFARRQALVFDHRHSVSDELAWLDAEGPTSPALLAHVRASRAAFECFIFFSYRYWHAFHGSRAVAGRAMLVPTAERDPAVGLSIFAPLFRGVRALMYNSHEERAMIQRIAQNDAVPGVVVGVGSDVPDAPEGDRFRQQFGITAPFAIYVGRIDENKGCAELFAFFDRYSRGVRSDLHLVLVGRTILPIPQHPRIHHLGFLDDRQKFDAIAAADVLIMPSYFESLSMVALEAWAIGTPVLANGRCDVLKGQVIRSRAGLYYESFAEFAEALHAITSARALGRALGENGRAYFRTHYAWPVIERKYVEMLDRLARDGEPPQPAMEPLPGLLARRRRTLPPATDVVARVPAGAVLP
jgi:glycosyltransferase involved in cell wall biosynthesis